MLEGIHIVGTLSGVPAKSKHHIKNNHFPYAKAYKGRGSKTYFMDGHFETILSS